MNRPILKFYSALCGLMLILSNHHSARADSLREAVQSAIQKADPSIVRLRVIGGEQSIDGDAVKSLVTTGIVISEDGEILTSQFALEGNPEAVLVEDQSGKRTNASIVATDSVRRIVLLKAKEGQWNPAIVDDNQPIEIGQWAIALGRFYTAESSNVSVGIISALNRIHGLAIQTDAKVSPVNYGGPLVTLRGSIAGILVPLSPRGSGSPGAGIEWYDSGIGFAIPLNDALKAAETLRKGEDLKPGRLGLRLAPGGAFDTNVVVDKVLPGGPSALAGLQKGDRILSLDGQIIDRSSVLMEAIARRYAGDSITFRLQRGESEITATVELAETLAPVSQGYLGLLPIRLSQQKNTPKEPEATNEADASEERGKKEDGSEPPSDIPRLKIPEILKKPGNSADDSDSVPLVVINDLPSATASLPTGIEILSINGVRSKSLAELTIAMEELLPESVAKIEYRIPGQSELLTIDIKASTRPEFVTRLSAAVLEQIQRSRPSSGMKVPQEEIETADGRSNAESNEIARQQFDFEERGRAVLLSSSHKSPVLPGLIVHLSADDIPEEQIVRHWGPVLKSHCLRIAIPGNPESAKLTSVDIPLVMTTIRAAVAQAGVDLRRVFVVANRSQSSLAWQCTFDGPSPIRGIALTDGWFSTSEIEGTEGSGHSVLLLDQATGIQASALRDLSRKTLREAGFWAPQPSTKTAEEPEAEEMRLVRCIGDWSLLARSF